MRTEPYFLPPLRELPPGRLPVRAQHLRAEITGSERSGRTRAMAIAAVGVGLVAVLLATPAFGLRDNIVDLFAAANQRPPELIQRFFRNMAGPNGVSPGVIPSKARVALSLSIPGFGHRVLWVAPTRTGGYCTTFACNPARRSPFDVSLQVAGPNSKTAPGVGSRDVHVFIEGATPLPNAATVAIRFDDGGSERITLVRTGKPIDAAFFVYELPKAHWTAGQRPVSLAIESASGQVLARDTRIGRYAREGVGSFLNPPPPPPAPVPTTFTDPAGDGGSALDITKLDVTENPDDVIQFDVTLAGPVDNAEDGPIVALDTDQNPDTGSAFYGTEVQIALVGRGNGEAVPVLSRAHGWDFKSSGSHIFSWSFGPHTEGFEVKRSALGLKPNQGFNIVVASASQHPDTAPDAGTFNYQPVAGAQPPPLGPDRRAPKVFAFDSSGVHGGKGNIGYWVLDGRGKTRQVIRIFRGRRLLQTIWTPLADTNPFGVSQTAWQVPARVRGSLRFTVRSTDAAGNKSKLSSATLLLR